MKARSPERDEWYTRLPVLRARARIVRWAVASGALSGPLRRPSGRFGPGRPVASSSPGSRGARATNTASPPVARSPSPLGVGNMPLGTLRQHGYQRLRLHPPAWAHRPDAGRAARQLTIAGRPSRQRNLRASRLRRDQRVPSRGRSAGGERESGAARTAARREGGDREGRSSSCSWPSATTWGRIRGRRSCGQGGASRRRSE